MEQLDVSHRTRELCGTRQGGTGVFTVLRYADPNS